MRTADSGVNSNSRPSMWERNTTLSSEIFRRSARLKTWKPPESVRVRIPPHEAVQSAELGNASILRAVTRDDMCCPE